MLCAIKQEPPRSCQPEGSSTSSAPKHVFETLSTSQRTRESAQRYLQKQQDRLSLKSTDTRTETLKHMLHQWPPDNGHEWVQSQMTPIHRLLRHRALHTWHSAISGLEEQPRNVNQRNTKPRKPYHFLHTMSPNAHIAERLVTRVPSVSLLGRARRSRKRKRMSQNILQLMNSWQTGHVLNIAARNRVELLIYSTWLYLRATTLQFLTPTTRVCVSLSRLLHPWHPCHLLNLPAN